MLSIATTLFVLVPVRVITFLRQIIYVSEPTQALIRSMGIVDLFVLVMVQKSRNPTSNLSVHRTVL